LFLNEVISFHPINLLFISIVSHFKYSYWVITLFCYNCL